MLLNGFSFLYLNKNIYVYRQRKYSITDSINNESLTYLKNNISRLIKDDYIDSAVYNSAYKSYLGFQLGILAYNMIKIKNIKIDDSLEFLVKHINFMKYTLDFRLKIFYLVSKIFGTKNLIKLMRFSLYKL
jgi:hypothetical protein